MTQPEISKRVKFFLISTGTTVASTVLDPAITYFPNDEIELPTIGVFRLVQRRWHIGADARILVLELAELH